MKKGIGRFLSPAFHVDWEYTGGTGWELLSEARNLMSEDDIKQGLADIEGYLLACERSCSLLSKVAGDMGNNPVAKMNISYFEWLVFLKYFLQDDDIRENILEKLKISGEIED